MPGMWCAGGPSRMPSEIKGFGDVLSNTPNITSKPILRMGFRESTLQPMTFKTPEFFRYTLDSRSPQQTIVVSLEGSTEWLVGKLRTQGHSSQASRVLIGAANTDVHRPGSPGEKRMRWPNR
ncbi:uncharacterized protein EI90DRAFT_3079448 [Cantharellus anzutake]|uniref:uncharacterized protein n=1 Tax=Cantharellus anzutake TaxID=1750568 RepID=UPI001908355D|nr:uncharacterized protein EI90DRAFT_3079448 [Cantharellus anzutake]KAF8321071.1 hypothetical protein EI90DRAFT_3079448 [Cantharellus anzutake]